MNPRNVIALAGVVVKELYRRKDFYVLFILTALLTLLMGSVTLFNDDKIVRYLKEMCLLLIWVCSLIIAIGTAVRQIPAEKEQRTIFPLLAKPVSRADVIVGKFLGVWIACGLCLLVFYVFFGVISGAKEGTLPVVNYFQALWLHWWLLAIVIALCILGSVVLSTPSANATICFVVTAGLLLVGQHLGKVAVRLPEPGSSIIYCLYFAVPHLEFFDVRDLVIHSGKLVDWFAWMGATLYAAVYTAFFLLAGWLLFRRKALN